MKGWLIVNSFLHSEKFVQLYSYLKAAANRRAVELEIKTTTDVICEVSSGFSQYVLPDFVLFWDKDVCLARRLQQAGAAVFNSADAIENCDNKQLTAICLAGKVATPRTVLAPKTFEGVGYCDRRFIDYAESVLHYPLVVKEAFGSFGQQVQLCTTREQLDKAVDLLGHKDFILQEFISSGVGRDVRINVVGGKVICAILRCNTHDFRSNITGGGTATPYEPSPAQQETAIAACRAVGADFAGVDVLFGANDEPIVCEVNSNPHFKSSLDCTGVDLSQYIIDYVVDRAAMRK